MSTTSDLPEVPAVSHKRRWWLAAGISALAGAAVLNHLQSRRAEATTPPAGRFVAPDGVRLHYLERGTGTPVILLHGNGVTLQDFTTSGVFDLLAERHRVLAFDRPGFGYSARPRTTVWTPEAQAALIVAALRELGTGKVTIVAHSWGTLVALAIALNYPDTVSGLVLLSGYYYPSARLDVPAFAPPAVPVLGDLLAHTLSPATGALLGPAVIKASFAPAPVSPKFAAFPLGLTLRPSQVHATAADTALMVPAAARLSKRYRSLSVPVMVMAGEGDRIVRLNGQAERFAREVPASDLRVVPGQGHLFHYAVPDQVAAAVDEVARRG